MCVFSPSAAVVSQSVLQGDSLSPMILNVLLSVLIWDIATQCLVGVFPVMKIGTSLLLKFHVCAKAGFSFLDIHAADLHFMAGSFVTNALRKMVVSGRFLWHTITGCGT